MPLRDRFDTVRKSASGWPITALYLGGTVTALMIVSHRLDPALGFVLMAVLFGAMLTVSVSREVKTVHHLVNSQRDELLVRIDQLIATLLAADVDVPLATEKGKDR